MEMSTVCFGLDPLYSGYRKMFGSFIKHNLLKKRSGNAFLFYFMNRPISKVEYVGCVTKIDSRSKRIVYDIDDGTDVIRCIKYLSNIVYDTQSCNSYQENHLLLELGDLVVVKGLIAMCESNSEPYEVVITVSQIAKVEDPNFESLHIMSCIILFESAYKRSLDVVSSNDFTPLLNNHSINRVSFDPFALCICQPVSNTTTKVKQQLLYCRCLSSNYGDIDSLDCRGKFAVEMLSFLLRLESVIPDNLPLVITFETIR